MQRRLGRDIVHRSEKNPIITIDDLTFRCADICNAGAIKFDDEYLLLLSIRSLQGFCSIYVARSTDGFELAEIDFAQRGPGDLFGTRQHGMPPLRIADLQCDHDLLEEARRDAQSLFAGDEPEFFRPQFERVKKQVLRRYGKALDLGDVG